MPRRLTPGAIADFRERLHRVAAELFVEAGEAGFNMRELARRAGVSAMTPYRYFSDREEILASIRQSAHARLTARLLTAQEQAGSAAEKLAAVAEAYVAFAQSEPDCYRLMFDWRRPKSGSQQESRNQPDEILILLTALLREATGYPEQDCDPEAMARILWSAMHGMVALEHGRSIAPENLTREIVRLLLARSQSGCCQSASGQEGFAILSAAE